MKIKKYKQLPPDFKPNIRAGTSGDWHDPRTWSPGVVPCEYDDVYIPSAYDITVGAGYGDAIARHVYVDGELRLPIRDPFKYRFASLNVKETAS